MVYTATIELFGRLERRDFPSLAATIVRVMQAICYIAGRRL